MKHFVTIVLVSLFLFPLTTPAQTTYQKTFGDTEFKVFVDLAAATNGDLVTAGYWTPSTMTTPVQPLLTRIDEVGNLLWTKAYTNPGIGRAAAISATADGGVLVVGKIDTILGTGGSDDGYVMKVDAAGDVQWMSVIGSVDDEWFTRVYEAPNGDVVAIGTWMVQATTDEYFWFVRMNATGTVLNSFAYFPTANAEARALSFHPDGGYLIAGIGRVNFIDEAFLFKISSTGVLEWFRSYGTFAGSEAIHDMVLLPDNSTVFVGTRYQANREIFIGKADSIGQLLWMRNYGGTDHDEAYRISEHTDGGFLVAGWTEGLGGAAGPLMIKFDATGTVEWANVYGNGVSTASLGLAKTSTGQWALAGTLLPNQSTAIGVVAQVGADGDGCDFTAVNLPLLMVSTNVDTPVVYATVAPSGTVAYTPTVNTVAMQDSSICLQVSTEEPIATQPQIFPNPVQDGHFQVFLPKPYTDPWTLRLSDMHGQTLITQTGTSAKINVATKGWPKGLYLLSLRHGARTTTHRILVR